MQRAKADGARVLIGGGPNEELGGLYYRPTLFADAPAGSEILRKEVFGPVLTVQAFEGEDEAVALANDTDYGLAAVLYTGDRERAERVSQRLVAGTVWVNCFFVRDLRERRSAARATPASAARAASGASISTRTSRTSAPHRGTKGADEHG